MRVSQTLFLTAGWQSSNLTPKALGPDFLVFFMMFIPQGDLGGLLSSVESQTDRRTLSGPTARSDCYRGKGLRLDTLVSVPVSHTDLCPQIWVSVAHLLPSPFWPGREASCGVPSGRNRVCCLLDCRGRQRNASSTPRRSYQTAQQGGHFPPVQLRESRVPHLCFL